MGQGSLSTRAKPTEDSQHPQIMCLQHVSSEGTRIVLHPTLALKGITLGRNSSRSHIVLGLSNRLSRLHACVKFSDGQWIIEDSGSINGVYVNDVKVSSRVLRLNDTVSFGDKIEKSTMFAYIFQELPCNENTKDNDPKQQYTLETAKNTIPTPEPPERSVQMKKRKRSRSPSKHMAQGRMKRRDILRELTCSICLESYINPVTCQCSHSFCRQCIESCLALNGQCPVCRYLINQAPVPSLSLKNQVMRCLSARDYEDYKQREEQYSAHQANMLRRSQKLQNSILQAKEQGLRFINVFETWRERDERIYQLGVRTYKSVCWKLFMNSIGLTEQSLQDRPISDLRTAFENLGGTMQDSLSPKILREMLWRFLMYGTPFSSS